MAEEGNLKDSLFAELVAGQMHLIWNVEIVRTLFQAFATADACVGIFREIFVTFDGTFPLIKPKS